MTESPKRTGHVTYRDALLALCALLLAEGAVVVWTLGESRAYGQATEARVERLSADAGELVGRIESRMAKFAAELEATRTDAAVTRAILERVYPPPPVKKKP